MTKKGFTGKKNPALTENPELETVLNGMIDKKPPEPDGTTAPMELTEPMPETAQQESKGIKLVRPQREPRNQHIQILVTARQRDKLKRIAAATGISVNEVINQAIDSLPDE